MNNQGENTFNPSDILIKYFNTPECKAVWQGWSDKLKGNIATQLLVIEQGGKPSQAYIRELQQAICTKVAPLTALENALLMPKYRSTYVRDCISLGSSLSQLQIVHNGNNITMLYGISKDGYFACLPGCHFGCHMHEAKELFRNAEKLSAKFDMATAISLAECIQEACSEISENNGLSPLPVSQSILHQPWATTLNLSTRARNALLRVGKYEWEYPGEENRNQIRTIQELAAMSPTDIYKIRNMGERSRKEVQNELRRIGVQASAWYKV